MDIVGISLVLLFYAVILLAGIWVAKSRGVLHPNTIQELMLAGRTLGLTLGIFSLVATEVGGAFVNGTAEEVFNKGMVWSIVPVGYSLSMTINGLFFVKKLSDKNCVTCIDALQNAYGQTLGGLVYLPSCLGDVCWTAAVLSALGSTLSVVAQADQTMTVSISAVVAILYTVVGGMYSVAYTDVIQLIFIFAGLWLAIPFMLTSEQTHLESLTWSQWTGTISSYSWPSYIDLWFLCLCGGIPWQPYYQRALALKTITQVRILSFAATCLCLICMIPPILIGGIAKSVDWTNLTQGQALNQSTSVVLPVALAELVPYPVGIAGLAAVSAAAMSSIDSSLLSGASYLTHNLYAGILRPQTSKSEIEIPKESREYIIVYRISVVVLGILATLLSLGSSSIYGLWVLAGDLGYVVVFPQFLAAVQFPHLVNATGSAVAALVSGILRLLIGEPLLNIPGAFHFPVYDDVDRSPQVPVKTLLMLISLFILVAVSYLKTKLSKRTNSDAYTFHSANISNDEL